MVTEHNDGKVTHIVCPIAERLTMSCYKCALRMLVCGHHASNSLAITSSQNVFKKKQMKYDIPSLAAGFQFKYRLNKPFLLSMGH
jgi:hypothetical protein